MCHDVKKQLAVHQMSHSADMCSFYDTYITDQMGVNPSWTLQNAGTTSAAAVANYYAHPQTMVILNIRTPTFSLIVTMFSVISEIAFLSATLSINSAFDSRKLRNGNIINVRKHRSRVVVLTLFAMISFVVLETIVGLTSDPRMVPLFRDERCVSSLLNFSRSRLDGSTLVQLQGNYSLETNQTRCSEEVMYKFIPSNFTDINRKDAIEDASTQGAHSLSFWKNDTKTLFLASLYPTRHTIVSSFQANFFDNTLDLSKEIQLKIATHLSQLSIICMTEEMEQRRLLFIGAAKRKCPFVASEIEATEIPLGVIILSIAVWVVSFVLFIVSLFWRKSILFDVSNPLHWAKHARHDPKEAHGNEPFLRTLDIGVNVVTIFGYENYYAERGKIRDAVGVCFRGIHPWCAY